MSQLLHLDAQLWWELQGFNCYVLDPSQNDLFVSRFNHHCLPIASPFKWLFQHKIHAVKFPK